MTEEIKTTEEKESKCFCKSEGFRNGLTIAIGTFVGFYCALSLFAALHKPPMLPPQAFDPQGMMRNGCPCKMINHHHHMKGDIGDFQHQPGNRPAPFVNKNVEHDD